jgi:hypothetical protein
VAYTKWRVIRPKPDDHVRESAAVLSPERRFILLLVGIIVPPR